MTQNSTDAFQANGIIQDNKTKEVVAQYIHDTLDSSRNKALDDAIKNCYFNSWLGLTTALIQN